MKKQIVFLILLIGCLCSSCMEEPTFRVIGFDNAKTTASSVTSSSAQLSCSVIEVEKGENSRKGYIWFQCTDNPAKFEGSGTGSWFEEKSDTRNSNSPAAGTYKLTISNLQHGTTYYYRPIFKDDYQSQYYAQGEIKSFTTSGASSITVQTGEVKNITSSSAVLYGKCTLNNGAVLQEAGMLLHTSSSLNCNSYGMRFSGTYLDYSANATGLYSDTRYYYRAYAIDQNGNIYYGAVKNFKTQADTHAPSPTVSDYLGTYDMHLYDPWDDTNPGYRTWTGVTISQASDGTIEMAGMPYYNNHAYGEWDAATHSIILTSEWYSELDLFESGGVNYYPIFTPVYYSKSEDYGYWTYGSDNIARIRVNMKADGTLEMIAPDSPGTSGYYSNAFLYRYIDENFTEWKGISDVVAEVTMTKKSSSSLPQAQEEKNIVRELSIHKKASSHIVSKNLMIDSPTESVKHP